MSENNSVAVWYAPDTVPVKIAAHIEAQVPQVTKILPGDVTLDKFWAGAWLEFVTTPKLNECTPQSLLKAVLKAAMLGHVPGRDCNFLPFKRRQGDKEWLEATMVEYYHGILRRLDRTGRVEWAKAEPVYKNDRFKCDELAEVYEFERHLDGDRGPLRCFFSAIKLKGSAKLLVRPCTLEDVDKVRAASPGRDQDVWVKWYEEKGRVTALKKHAKYLQLVDEDAEEADAPVATSEEVKVLIADTHGDRDATAAARERAIRRDPLPEVIVDAMPEPVREHIRGAAGAKKQTVVQEVREDVAEQDVEDIVPPAQKKILAMHKTAKGLVSQRAGKLQVPQGPIWAYMKDRGFELALLTSENLKAFAEALRWYDVEASSPLDDWVAAMAETFRCDPKDIRACLNRSDGDELMAEAKSLDAEHLPACLEKLEHILIAAWGQPFLADEEAQPAKDTAAVQG